MHLCSLLTSISLLTIQTQATPLAPDITAANPVNPPNRAINATILDHIGRDISSSFDIRLYYPEAPAANNNLSARQTSLSRSRPINVCPGLSEFISSRCAPTSTSAPGSLQAYTITCRTTFAMENGIEKPVRNNALFTYAAVVGGPPVTRQETIHRDGHCEADEICVPGLGEGRGRGGRSVASCVATEWFVRYISWRENGQGKEQEGDGEGEKEVELAGRVASAVVSEVDGSTAVEVDTLEVDTTTGTAGEVKTIRCRDCVRLKTERFEADTEGLRVQARLLTAGAGVVGGVLWLALVSG